MKKRGFTLIELLVVVAIIAIIAAIALPNFLEAQTRSKVSRVKADLRTLATALEMYRLDINRYPPDSDHGEIVYLRRLAHLTTPIAYITAVPPDPFANKGQILKYTATKGFNPYADPATSSNWVFPLTYDFAARRQSNGSWEPITTWARISSRPDAVQWGIRSAGPDKWPAWLGESVAPYDPTNGTVSEGNIFWTGPGIGEDKPYLLP